MEANHNADVSWIGEGRLNATLVRDDDSDEEIADRKCVDACTRRVRRFDELKLGIATKNTIGLKVGTDERVRESYESESRVW